MPLMPARTANACFPATQSWLYRSKSWSSGSVEKDAYLVTLFSPVSDLHFTETLAFIDGDHNGMICGDGGDKISIPGSSISSFPTLIKSMRKVDDAELVALGEKYKMKLISDKRAQAVKSHDKQIHE
jgi:hypothetical protein